MCSLELPNTGPEESKSVDRFLPLRDELLADRQSESSISRQQQ